MWLITNFGFFSVVQKPDDPAAGTLTVRARVKGDLETLRDRYLPDLGDIVADAGTDYRFRAKAPRTALSHAVARAILDIDYANFKNSVAKTQGHERSHIYGEVWIALHALEARESPLASNRETVGSTPVLSGTAYGGALFDESGRVLLCEPAGHFDGYHWTFPKGLPSQTAGSAAEVALREVLEETGYHAEIVGRVPGSFRGGTGQSVFFLMRSKGAPEKPDSTEIASVRWASFQEAHTLIGNTTNAVGRRRDFDVLEAAFTAFAQTRPESLALDSAGQGSAESEAVRPLDLYRFLRKLLRMVRELHRGGYELLRVEAGMSPSGCHWRCAIAPAALFSKKNGAMIIFSSSNMSQSMERPMIARYSSGSLFDCYGWGDCSKDSPVALADRFRREFPQILERARGADPAYVQWFEEMLVRTEPTGLPIAYADWTLPDNAIEVIGHPDVLNVTWPPPGLG